MSRAAPATPAALLRAIDALLTSVGGRAEPGVEVDLDPIFAPLFLGSEITRLEAVVAEAERSLGWLQRVPGPGRRYRVTAAGAAAAIRPPDTPRRTLVIVAVAALAAAALFWLLLR